MNGVGRSITRPGYGRLASALVLAGLTLAGGVAGARPPRYLGPHPVPASVGRLWCRLAVPHVHSYGPDHGALYAQAPEGFIFAGDPTPFGYQGPRHVYYGHHPLPDRPEVFCYLGGPHYHALPPSGAGWKIVDGVAFFVGPMTGVYERERVVRGRAWEIAYREVGAERPRVTVAPPPEWKGEVWTPTGPVAAPAPVAAPPSAPPSVPSSVPPSVPPSDPAARAAMGAGAPPAGAAASAAVTK